MASGTGAPAYSYLLSDRAINLLFAKLRAKGGLWKETNEKPKGKVMNFTVNLKRRAPDLGYLYTVLPPLSFCVEQYFLNNTREET